jgi:hypothetical protein
VEYNIWDGMVQRTTNPKNPKFPRYGGRGITMCVEWRGDFARFYADMGPRPSPKHSIERQNNDGDYTPENCCWATAAEQSRNTRLTRFITVNEQTRCISEWAEVSGLSKTAIHSRLHASWPEDLAVTLPKGSRLKDVSG